MTSINTIVDRLNWPRIGTELGAEGYVLLPGLMDADQIESLVERMQKEGERKIPPPHAADLGGADVRYFGVELPTPLDALRTALYGHLAMIANRWNNILGIADRYPVALDDFLLRNQQAGQKRGQSYLSRLGVGDHMPLHQRNDGEQVKHIALQLETQQINGNCTTKMAEAECVKKERERSRTSHE